MNQNRIDHIYKKLLDFFNAYNAEQFAFEVTEGNNAQKYAREITEMVSGRRSKRVTFAPRENESKSQTLANTAVLNGVTNALICKTKSFS